MEFTYDGLSETIVATDQCDAGSTVVTEQDGEEYCKEKIRKIRLMQEAGRLLKSYTPKNTGWTTWTIDSDDLLRSVWRIGYEWIYGFRAPKESITKDLVEGCNNDFLEFHEAIEYVLSSDTDLSCCVDLDLLMDALVEHYLSDETLRRGSSSDPWVFDRFRYIMGLIQLILMVNMRNLPSEAPGLFRYEKVHTPNCSPVQRNVRKVGGEQEDLC